MSDVGSVLEWKSIADEYESSRDNNIVRFFWKDKPNERQSQIDGRPRFDLIPYIEIFAPGQIRNTRIERKVTEEDKVKYAAQWAKFEANSEATDGTPIEEWPYLNRAQVSELKAIGFLTVESLAETGDTGISKLGPGGRDLVNRAKQFLKPQDARETEIRAEMQDLKDRILKLESERDHWKQVAESKPRGRPRKVRDDDAENGLSNGA